MVLHGACSVVTVLYPLASLVGVDSPSQSLHERAAAAKFKYKLGEIEHIPCAKKGARPCNRQIMEDKVHKLYTTFLQDGWDSGEEGGTVVQEDPGKNFILQHNLDMLLDRCCYR